MKLDRTGRVAAQRQHDGAVPEEADALLQSEAISTFSVQDVEALKHMRLRQIFYQATLSQVAAWVPKSVLFWASCSLLVVIMPDGSFRLDETSLVSQLCWRTRHSLGWYTTSPTTQRIFGIWVLPRPSLFLASSARKGRANVAARYALRASSLCGSHGTRAAKFMSVSTAASARETETLSYLWFKRRLHCFAFAYCSNTKLTARLPLHKIHA